MERTKKMKNKFEFVQKQVHREIGRSQYHPRPEHPPLKFDPTRNHNN